MMKSTRDVAGEVLKAMYACEHLFPVRGCRRMDRRSQLSCNVELEETFHTLPAQVLS